MMEEAQVRTITKKVLDEEHLLGLIKIFEKEHNLFRGSHDKIQLPAALNIPDTIINQIVEKFDTQLTEGSVPYIDGDQHFTEDNDEFFYDEAQKVLCLGLNSPETDMVRGFCIKEGTPPTQDIVDTIQVYAMDTPLERLTDGGLETWAGASDLTYWDEFDDGAGGSVDQEGSEVHGGTYSCKLTTTQGGDYCGIYQSLSLNPGYNCRVAAWHLRTAHAGSVLRLYVRDSGLNVSLKSDGTWQANSAAYLTIPVSEVWTLFELEFVAHANYSSYEIRLYKDHSAGGAVSFYVDDVSISENKNVIPYFRTEAGTVIGLNQDQRTTASVIYAGLTLTQFSGVLKAVDGVVTEAADHVDLANITSDQHHPQAHTLASHSTKAHSELTGVTSDQHHAQSHGPSHHSGGGDAIQLDNLASPDDNTDLNALTTKHGLLPKLGGGTINFLRADGTWAAPAAPADAATKTTGAWSKSIGSGGDYADWATMIAAMPDLLAHATTVTIKAGTSLTETCEIKNKHGITSAGVITVKAEKYYPTTGAIPTADSATATTLRDAALAAEAYGDDYFNNCWILIVHGTGTDNGFRQITDYVDATGDVVVSGWSGTQPDNTSRYIIVGAMIDGESARTYGIKLEDSLAVINILGIGIIGVNYGVLVQRCFYTPLGYVATYGVEFGVYTNQTSSFASNRCGWVACTSVGIFVNTTLYANIVNSAFSDNTNYGNYITSATFAYLENNFGDNNGNWGSYCQFSGQGRFIGTECSGATGNHSDPGTAGNANADQAAGY